MNEILEMMQNMEKPEDDELLSYTYPEGFARALRYLDFIPDDTMKIQMVSGLLNTLTGA